MTEEFRKERAMTLRAIAEKADPFTKKRLLDLAAKYARAQRPPIQIPSISAELAQKPALARAPQGWSRSD
jgi:hypothetical protein